MNLESLENLKYPIGKFKLSEPVSDKQINKWISILENYPNKLSKLVIDLNDTQLDTTYRDNGWTIRQVIHHVADSHHNSFTRFKWALTEHKPMIKAYYEARWAELHDSRSAPIDLSLNYIKVLHAKWVYLLKGLDATELKKTFIHPDGNKEVTLAENIGIYAWHCDHHYAHIENLLYKKSWK